MLKSMTGFGKAKYEDDIRIINVEIKSLNSKNFDIRLKIPSVYTEKEILLKNELSKKLVRGKVECTIEIENKQGESKNYIDKNVVSNYYKQLQEIIISNDDKVENTDIYQIIMRMPEVVKSKNEEIAPQEWLLVLETTQKAIQDIIEFRNQEGKVLQADFKNRINIINNLLVELEPFEIERTIDIKAKLTKSLEKLSEIDYDKNRLEQELIFYIEKLDITEEKVRLSNHCKYFLETINEEISAGKKLSFISQEIGREINTIGSKANNYNIQKIVVQMKDELEKIKEQMMNVL